MEASEDCSDKRLFEGYYNNIESLSSFNDDRVKVLLSLSLDGFVPRRIQSLTSHWFLVQKRKYTLTFRREIWPLCLRVDGLPPSEADKFINSIVAGTMLSRLKPSEKMIELFSRLDSELRSLREAPLEIVIGDVLWTVEVELFRADMAVILRICVTCPILSFEIQAQQVLFGIPRWKCGIWMF
ncbi:unnamed protein product [Cylicostephanus goldi]|uniref:Uncharacterized protein n=1 Tax=Cylicostephanus goldi TaxID=71465 RepID=A0A3P6QJC5_CYLGO|nr:unnamed protein product [Cylicostephanus goldi]